MSSADPKSDDSDLSLRLLCVLAALAVGACSKSMLTVSNGPAATQARSTQITLEPYFAGLRTVTVGIGVRKLRFLVDTGGGSTLIVPELARELGCKPFGRDVGHRLSGERVVFQRCERAVLQLGGLTIVREPIAVFDVNALLPVELPRLDGVLALDSFRGRIVTLDWPRSVLTIESAVAPTMRVLPQRWATGDNGRTLSALLPLATPRGDAWFLLDSGDVRGTLVDKHLIDEHLLALDDASNATLVVAGQPAVNLPVIVTDIETDGVLGTAWLERGAVTLDLRNAP